MSRIERRTTEDAIQVIGWADDQGNVAHACRVGFRSVSREGDRQPYRRTSEKKSPADLAKHKAASRRIAYRGISSGWCSRAPRAEFPS